LCLQGLTKDKIECNERVESLGWRQVGGWVEEYEDCLTFATIRGVGHQVPIFAPQVNFIILIRKYLYLYGMVLRKNIWVSYII